MGQLESDLFALASDLNGFSLDQLVFLRDVCFGAISELDPRDDTGIVSSQILYRAVISGIDKRLSGVYS